MAKLGFTHVDLGWGLDTAALALRVDDTNYALRACRRAGLGVYFIVWHPVDNSLPRRPEFQQADVLGRLRFAFNTFNPEWRETQWKQYLETLARLYAQDPAFAGYIFDDSFEIGRSGVSGGPGGAPAERMISYSADDLRRLGKVPPRQPSDPDRALWTRARAGWGEDWAQDTNRCIREVDANRDHEVHLEDGAWVLSQRAQNTAGVDFGRAAKHFDRVGAYTVARWDDEPDSGQRAVEQTVRVLEKDAGDRRARQADHFHLLGGQHPGTAQARAGEVSHFRTDSRHLCSRSQFRHPARGHVRLAHRRLGGDGRELAQETAAG
jgi:hypothetical protein